ncbi:MAG: hypothetical protein EOQ39_18670 [Mesorhizobium sp.]|uniref:hypothetical protein n=1 Tax=Mesorhizobium sp. TaxID=1871066 RepID=UPI000FEA8456|nr:hypothetical protein [Mesorhizobium sp.]RWB08805.1 MAG: hypothetical protein EOQ37_04670 [Mesorhizobium sp.]RWB13544.1 MAG: hypothetical protein EOQ39_18670 [Mesorhizobium sp.]
MPSPANSTSTPSSSFRVGNKVTINDPELDLHPNTVGTVVGHHTHTGWPNLYIPGIPFGHDNRWHVDPQYLTRVPRIPVGGIRVRRIAETTDRIKKGTEATVDRFNAAADQLKLVGYDGYFLTKHFEVIK